MHSAQFQVSVLKRRPATLLKRETNTRLYPLAHGRKSCAAKGRSRNRSICSYLLHAAVKRHNICIMTARSTMKIGFVLTSRDVRQTRSGGAVSLHRVAPGSSFHPVSRGQTARPRGSKLALFCKTATSPNLVCIRIIMLQSQRSRPYRPVRSPLILMLFGTDSLSLLLRRLLSIYLSRCTPIRVPYRPWLSQARSA